ncbi:MAG TPA: phosphodiester glycosidase family protein [Oligoflexia bacterium]|nr:phosphodiester glycosidase family protein [Oligoflexia bacterium]HMP27796.1 phosphodiester glycosidase family protein [Oligoflexia bacterium]
MLSNPTKKSNKKSKISSNLYIVFLHIFYGLFSTINLLAIDHQKPVANHAEAANPLLPLISQTIYTQTEDYLAISFPQGKIALEIDTRKELAVEDRCFQAIACINGNFFSEDFKPLGLVKNNSLLLSPLKHNSKLLNGVFLWNNASSQNGAQQTFKPLITTTEDSAIQNYHFGIQAGPLLLLKGTLLPLSKAQKEKRAERAAICLAGKEKITFVVSKKRILLEEFAKYLIFSLKCSSALNLDGGSSTQLVAAKEIGIRHFGRTNVPVLIKVLPAKEKKS